MLYDCMIACCFTTLHLNSKYTVQIISNLASLAITINKPDTLVLGALVIGFTKIDSILSGIIAWKGLPSSDNLSG